MNQAGRKIIGTGTIPDGYFGDRRAVTFELQGNRIITVADCGSFGTPLPDCETLGEARHLLKRHPNAKDITLVNSNI